MAFRRPETDATAAELVTAALVRSVSRVIDHEAGVRSGEDAEDVHQARVGTRRLRSDLRSFRKLLEASWARELRDAVKPLADRLGAVRDADVLLGRLRRRVQELAEKDLIPAGLLLRRLEAERTRARQDLLTWMEGPDYALLRERLLAAARHPALLPRARLPALELLGPMVERRWKRLARSVEALSSPPSSGELHQIRIRAKRCRYAAECLVPVAGRPAREFAKAMAHVQDVLGEHQDATVAAAWLREAARSGPAEEAFVAGELVARERRAAEEARALWPEAWRSASKRRLRGWL